MKYVRPTHHAAFKVEYQPRYRSNSQLAYRLSAQLKCWGVYCKYTNNINQCTYYIGVYASWASKLNWNPRVGVSRRVRRRDWAFGKDIQTTWAHSEGFAKTKPSTGILDSSKVDRINKNPGMLACFPLLGNIVYYCTSHGVGYNSARAIGAVNWVPERV